MELGAGVAYEGNPAGIANDAGPALPRRQVGGPDSGCTRQHVVSQTRSVVVPIPDSVTSIMVVAAEGLEEKSRWSRCWPRRLLRHLRRVRLLPAAQQPQAMHPVSSTVDIARSMGEASGGQGCSSTMDIVVSRL